MQARISDTSKYVANICLVCLSGCPSVRNFDSRVILANMFEGNVMILRNLTYLLLFWFCLQMCTLLLVIRFHRYSPVGVHHWSGERAHRLEMSALQSRYGG